MSRKIDMLGVIQFIHLMAVSRPIKIAPEREHQAGGIYMYPKNFANAKLTPPEEEEALAERHMQMAPHSYVERRAVMQQPQVVMPVLSYGYMRTKSASDEAAVQGKQTAIAAPRRGVQAKPGQRAAQFILVAYELAAVKAAKRAARQAAVETANREAQHETAEQATRQAALDAAEQAARQQAEQNTAAWDARKQADLEAAEQEARQQAEQQAAQIGESAARTTAHEPSTRSAPPEAATQTAQTLRTEGPGAFALAVLQMMAKKRPLFQQTQQPLQSAAQEAAPVQQFASESAPVQQSAPEAAPVQQTAPDSVPVQQTAPEAVPVQQAAPAQAPVQQAAPAQTPVKQAVPVQAPVQQVQQDTPADVPVQQPVTTQVPMQQAAPAQTPVKKAVPVQAPVQQVQQDTPADVPVQQPVTTQVPMQQAAPVTVPPAAVPAVSTFGVPAALHFCTVTGSSYLFKVVALYRSLEAYSGDFMLYVCCIDGDTQSALEKLHLPRCVAVSVDALGDGGLAALRGERSASEFCWTLKSYFLLWLLAEKGLPEAVYLDSDVAFFSNPKQLYDDWGNASVYLCRQRDLDWVEQKYGKYQAGVIGFRNDEPGMAAVRWWRDKCRAWCFAAPDTGQYGDQKYLDDIPALFRSVRISTHRGIDAAPWNTVYNNNYPISVSDGEIRIDGDPLVAYHFACLDVIDEQHFDLWNLSGISIGQTVSNAIYVPYLARLRDSVAEVQAKTGGKHYSRKTFGDAKTPYIFSDKNLSISHWDGVYGFCTIASKQYAARTLALYSSLEKHAGNFHIWICCMDDTAYAILSSFGLKNATLIKVSDVETAEVKATRGSKKLYEYCWTMKPLLCQHVFQNYNISRLLYCDADMYFFASPQAVYNEWRRYETFLNLQRGTAQLEAVHGMYQAGLIGFTKAAESLRILNWWARQCSAWCYDNHDDHSRWGDQKYLTQIPNLFTSIKVNNRYGLLAAPWNIVMNNSKDLPVHTDAGGTVWIGDEALTCFHFGSINVLSESSFDLWKHEPLRFDPAIIESIYKPYLGHLRGIYGEIRTKGFNVSELFETVADAQNPFALEG